MESDEFQPTPQPEQQPRTRPAPHPAESPLASASAKLDRLRLQYAQQLGLPADIDVNRLYDIMERVGFDSLAIRDISDELERLEASDEYISQLAERYGLPQTASWEEICARRNQVIAADRARALGLPEDTSYEEAFEAFFRQETLQEARKLGLPDAATEQQIKTHKDQRERIVIASLLGWSDDPLYIQTALRLGKDPFPSWRDILTNVLGLSRSSTLQEITQQLSEGRHGKRWR